MDVIFYIHPQMGPVSKPSRDSGFRFPLSPFRFPPSENCWNRAGFHNRRLILRQLGQLKSGSKVVKFTFEAHLNEKDGSPSLLRSKPGSPLIPASFPLLPQLELFREIECITTSRKTLSHFSDDFFARVQK